MSRKKRWLWIPIVLVLAIGGGLAFRSEPADDMAEFAPYITSSEVDYMSPRNAFPGTVSYGVKERRVTLKGISMDKFLAAMDRRMAKEGGWSKPRMGRYEYFFYTAARGSGFDIFAMPTIQAFARPKGFAKKAIKSEDLAAISISYLETKPLSRWDAIWLRAKNLGRDPFEPEA